MLAERLRALLAVSLSPSANSAKLHLETSRLADEGESMSAELDLSLQKDADILERNRIKKLTMKPGDLVYMPELTNRPGRYLPLVRIYYDEQYRDDMAMLDLESGLRRPYPLRYVEPKPGTERPQPMKIENCTATLGVLPELVRAADIVASGDTSPDAISALQLAVANLKSSGQYGLWVSGNH